MVFETPLQMPKAPKPVIDPKERGRLFKRPGNHCCFVCGNAKAAPHHVIPRSEGGEGTADNIVWLCENHHNEAEGDSAGAWSRIYSLRTALGFDVVQSATRRKKRQLVWKPWPGYHELWEGDWYEV